MAKKALKRFKNISLGLLAGLVFLLLLAGGLLNAPFVHRFVAGKAADWATEYMHCKVDMGKVELVLLKRSLRVHDLVIYDCQGQPTVYAREAWAVLHDFDFKNLTLQNARLTDPCIRITRYEGDSMSDFKRVLQKIAVRPKKDSALRKPFQMLAFEIENATFYYDDFNRPEKNNGTVDFKHIRLTEGHLKGRNFYTRIGVVRADIDHLRAKEGSGVKIEDFATHIELDKGELHFTSAHIKTQGSDLNLNLSLEAGVPDWKPYADFVHRVRLEADVRPSRLALPDLRRFVAAVGEMQGSVNLSSQVKGPVSDLDLHNLKLAFGTHTALQANLQLQGLPDTLNLNLDLHRLHAEKQDLRHLVLPNGETLPLPEILQDWEALTLNGTLNGNLEKFASDFDLKSNLGNIRFRNSVVDTLGGPAVMVGRLDASSIRLDKLSGMDSLLGLADFGADFYLVGKTFETLHCEVDGTVSNLQVSDKTLQPVKLDLHLQKGFFGGRVECRDPNLDFRLSGNLDFRANDSRSHCELDLRNIDLKPLRLFGDTGDFRAATFLRVAFTGRQYDSIDGHIRLMNTKIHRLGASYAMPDMRLALVREGEHRWAYVRSGLLDFDLYGFWSFASLDDQVRHLLALQIPALFDTVPSQGMYADSIHPMHYTMHLKVKEADTLLQLFFPDVRIPVGLSGEMNYEGDAERLAFSLDLPYLQYHRFAYMNGGIQAEFSPEKTSLLTQAGSLYLDDSIRLPNFSLSLVGAEKDVLDYALMWDGALKSGLYGNFHFYPGPGIRFEIEESGVFLEGSLWRNYEGSYLFFAPDSIIFGQFGFRSSDVRSGVVLNGELSHKPSSHLRVDFDEFSLDYLHYFLRKIHMDVEGNINGYAQVNDFYEMFSFEADLNIDSLLINRHPYGRLEVGSSFSRKDAISLGVHLKENRQGKPFETLSFDGTFYRTQGKKLDFRGKVNAFPVHFLSGFLASVASGLEGTLNGDLKVGGTLSAPALYAEVKTNNLSATIPFLGTRYTFTDMALQLTSDKISFERGRFTDEDFRSNGTLKGSISHHNFKNMRLDMGLDFQKLLAVNTKRSHDMPFWGKVLASGALRINGPVNDLAVSLSAVVDNPSDIHFDFSTMSVNSGANFIRFESETPVAEDSSKLSFEKFYARTRSLARRRSNHLSMDLSLGINPGLAVSVGLGNAAMDGTLSATGNGLLRLSSKNGTTRLFGTYTISDGEFDISMVDIINKKFELEEGGTISWVGPIDDARIHVRAGYQTRASLYPILSQFSTTDEDRRMQKSDVKSIIILSGNLLNPDISFDIDLMNTDEDSKDKFFAVVKKDDEDEMLRQTFSLLMFNSFMALDNSSAGIGSAALSSSSDLLFSQFNNFLSQFTENFNIGLNYSPNVSGSNSGLVNSEFQVMMSGQLFNDRLLINGNLGVSENGAAGVSAGRSATNVVGEVDVEWKFTEELRLKAFNHSNEQDLTKPANSYTQGVGVVFKRDFDNWKEFIYGSKGKRTKEQRQEERAQKREERETKKEFQREGREARRSR